MTITEPVAVNGTEPKAVLSASGVTVRFGGLTALSEVDISIPAGSLVGLVGPNGAGKTTLFGVMSGLLHPNKGRVNLVGTDVTKASCETRAQLGLARTFQQPELFLDLTVREHLVLAYRVRHHRSRLWKDLFTAGCLKRPDPAETARVDWLLQLLSLNDVAHQPVRVLPLGTSRLVEVGRALATAPAIVLLDEPSAGLDGHETERLSEALRCTVMEEKVSLLLVEHDVGMVLSLSSEIYVLDFGSVIAQGTPAEIRENPEVRAAYLGDEDIAICAP
jgi:ABC-type branched-subunit amino acid transport system ATPase component